MQILQCSASTNVVLQWIDFCSRTTVLQQLKMDLPNITAFYYSSLNKWREYLLAELLTFVLRQIKHICNQHIFASEGATSLDYSDENYCTSIPNEYTDQLLLKYQFVQVKLAIESLDIKLLKYSRNKYVCDYLVRTFNPHLIHLFPITDSYFPLNLTKLFLSYV